MFLLIIFVFVLFDNGTSQLTNSMIHKPLNIRQNLLNFNFELEKNFWEAFNHSMNANQIIHLKLDDISEMLRAVEGAFGEKFFRGTRHHEITSLKYLSTEINTRYRRLFKCVWYHISIKVKKICIQWISLKYVEQLNDWISKIRKIVFPTRSYVRRKILNLFEEISKITHEDNSKNMCGKTVSSQSSLFDMYKVLAATEIRAYLMTILIYDTFQAPGKNFKNELTTATNNFTYWYSRYLTSTKNTVIKAPTSIHSCDPEIHIRHKTYIELERNFQAYVVSAIKDDSGRQCGIPCPLSKNYNCTHNNIIYPEYFQQCTDFTDCMYIGTQAEFCITPDTMTRYQWIKFADGTVYGADNGPCTVEVTRVNKWNNMARNNGYGHYCLCTCNARRQERNVIRAISLMSQMADIYKNMVITGIKFELSGGMIQIRIKQGQLMAVGQVINGTDKWKSLRDINQTVNSTGEESYYGTFDNSTILLQQTEHYDLITKNRKRVYLDDIILPDGYVVTGVAIGPKRYDTKNPHFELKIHATPFDFITGKLTPTLPNPSKWFDQHTLDLLRVNKKPPRTELKLEHPGSPLHSADDDMNSWKNQYIDFRASDLFHDAGQTTVPFFDAQPVETLPGFPLAGIGLAHRAAARSGGNIVFKLFTIDVSNYFKY